MYIYELQNKRTYPIDKDTINHQTKKANISVSCQPSLFNLSDISKKKVEIKFTMEDTSNDGGLLYGHQ